MLTVISRSAASLSVLCLCFSGTPFIGTARAQAVTSSPSAEQPGEHQGGILEDWLKPWCELKADLREARVVPTLGLTFITQSSIGGLDRNGAVRETLSADYGLHLTLFGAPQPVTQTTARLAFWLKRGLAMVYQV